MGVSHVSSIFKINKVKCEYAFNLGPESKDGPPCKLLPFQLKTEERGVNTYIPIGQKTRGLSPTSCLKTLVSKWESIRAQGDLKSYIDLGYMKILGRCCSKQGRLRAEPGSS